MGRVDVARQGSQTPASSQLARLLYAHSYGTERLAHRRWSATLGRMSSAARPPRQWTRLSLAAAGILTTLLLATLLAFVLLARPSGDSPGSTAEGSGPPGPVGALDSADDGTFRLALEGGDIAALIEEAMHGSPIKIDGLGVTVDEAGPEAVALRIDGVVEGPKVPAHVDLELRRVGTTLDVALSDVKVIGMSLPEGAFGAVDEVLDQAADFGGLLEDARIELTGLQVDDGQIVLTGYAEDTEALEEQLRAAARQRAHATGAREAPEERLGPGRAERTDMAPERLYVAIGDSITAAASTDDHRDGFTSRLHAALEDRDGAEWGYANLGENGSTARSVADGDQLPMATALLAQRDVDLVTVTVGSNELLALLDEPPCADDLAGSACAREVEETVAAFRDELRALLGSLADADPEAPIVVVGLYNPFSLGTGSEFEARADQAVSRLSAIAEAEAAEHGAAFAAVQSAFHERADSVTLMGETPPDVHPSPLGHDVLAVGVLEALDELGETAGGEETALGER